MKDQNEKIKGYRDLSPDEINLINEGKELAEKCGDYIEKLQSEVGGSESLFLTDKRLVSLAKTNLQQGFMWAIRSIAKPTSF